MRDPGNEGEHVKVLSTKLNSFSPTARVAVASNTDEKRHIASINVLEIFRYLSCRFLALFLGITVKSLALGSLDKRYRNFRA